MGHHYAWVPAGLLSISGLFFLLHPTGTPLFSVIAAGVRGTGRGLAPLGSRVHPPGSPSTASQLAPLAATRMALPNRPSKTVVYTSAAGVLFTGMLLHGLATLLSWLRAERGPAAECRWAALATAPTSTPSPLPPLPAPVGCAPVRLHEVRVPVADRFIAVVLPVSELEVLNLYEALDWLDGDPYWAALWGSAQGLAAEVLRRPELVRGKRVLDLGCGVGLAGLAAAVAGAREVVLADREPRALHCALQGAVLNNLAVDPAITPAVPNAAQVYPPLSFSTPNSGPPADSAAGGPRVRAAVVDWHHLETALQNFDVVLACDVLYERQSVAPVSAIVPQTGLAGGE
eukprot:EG_transcript_11787